MPSDGMSSGASTTLTPSATLIAPATAPATTPTTRSIETADTTPGAALMSEARACMATGQWKQAVTVLESARQIRNHDHDADALLALAATYAGDKATAEASVARLRQIDAPGTNQLAALAQVALAREDFISGDILSRRAVEIDDTNGDAWAALSASYAGLGWFDDAETCLERSDSLGRSPHTELVIGRAVNNWAMTRTFALVISAILFVFIGILALAVGVTIPFIARELRVAQLPTRFAAAADTAWRKQTRLRLMHCSAVAGILLAWTSIMFLA